MNRKRAVILGVTLAASFCLLSVSYTEPAEAFVCGGLCILAIAVAAAAIGGYIGYQLADTDGANPNDNTEEEIHRAYMNSRLAEINNLYTRTIAEDRNMRMLYDNMFLNCVRYTENEVPSVLEYDTWDEAITHMDAFNDYESTCKSVLLYIMGSTGYADSLVLDYFSEADSTAFVTLKQAGAHTVFNDYGLALVNNTYAGTWLGEYLLNFVVIPDGEFVIIDGVTYTASGCTEIEVFNSADLGDVMSGDFNVYTISAVSDADNVYINGVRSNYPLGLFDTDNEPSFEDLLLADWDDVASGLDSGTSGYFDFENTGVANSFETITDYDLSSPNSFKSYAANGATNVGYWNLTNEVNYVDEINFSFYWDTCYANYDNKISFCNDLGELIIITFIRIGDDPTIRWYDNSTGSHDLYAGVGVYDKRNYIVISHNGTNQFNIQVLGATFNVLSEDDYAGAYAGDWSTFTYVKVTARSGNENPLSIYYDNFYIDGSENNYDYFTRNEGADNITLDYSSEADIYATEILSGRSDYAYFNEWHDSFNIIYDAMYDAGYALFTTYKGLGYNAANDIPNDELIIYPDWLMSNLEALQGVNQSEFYFMYYALLSQLNESFLWAQDEISADNFNITDNFADYMLNATLERSGTDIFNHSLVWCSVLHSNMAIQKGQTITLNQTCLFYNVDNNTIYMGYSGDNLTIHNITYKSNEIDNTTLNITTLGLLASSTYGITLDQNSSFTDALAAILAAVSGNTDWLLYAGVGAIIGGVILMAVAKDNKAMSKLGIVLIVLGIVILLWIYVISPLLGGLGDGILTIFGKGWLW